jgi:hypothetical protein
MQKLPDCSDECAMISEGFSSVAVQSACTDAKQHGQTLGQAFESNMRISPVQPGAAGSILARY